MLFPDIDNQRDVSACQKGIKDREGEESIGWKWKDYLDRLLRCPHI